MKDFEYTIKELECAIKELERALQIVEDCDCDEVIITRSSAGAALAVLKAMVKDADRVKHDILNGGNDNE